MATVWPTKCRQESKANKSNCRFEKKWTYYWLLAIPVRIYLARDHSIQSHGQIRLSTGPLIDLTSFVLDKSTAVELELLART
jgi:hypothetical protein